jgi:hypothetical protein
MKIADIAAGKALVPRPEPRQARESSRAFEELLNTSVAREEGAAAAAASGVHGMRPAPPVFFDAPPVDREALAGRVAQFLDELERYAGGLGSPSTLKDLAPLISRISDEQAQLQQLAETLPPQDDLRRIIDEALIRSSVEVIRFNRGDYL